MATQFATRCFSSPPDPQSQSRKRTNVQSPSCPIEWWAGLTAKAGATRRKCRLRRCRRVSSATAYPSTRQDSLPRWFFAGWLSDADIAAIRFGDEGQERTLMQVDAHCAFRTRSSICRRA
ncbi:hypothetical protein [Burkholderia sp. Bp9012]|uniref:hypothetical protein n=1 Tax=Burkholderia sp. Bp9012 TaxID=2184562 RepID=UPI000F599B50|nr:hypothetical protein [Burkholderia sp. Bp9012]